MKTADGVVEKPMFYAKSWKCSSEDSVIGISVFGNLDICLHSCHLRCCSAAGLVYHVDMPLGYQRRIYNGTAESAIQVFVYLSQVN